MINCRWMLRVTLAIAAVFAAAVAGHAGSVTINEIRIDQPGDDNDEYVELAGPEGTSLDGLTYLVIGDGTGGSGVIEAVVDLTGSSIGAGSGGFFLAAESTFSLGPTPDLVTTLDFENSDNVTHLLVSGFTGADGDDLDLDDDCVLDVMPWASIVDSVSLKESDPPDCFYSPAVVGPDGSFVPGHVFRCADGSGDFVIGAFDPAGGDDTPRAPNACPAVVVAINELRIDQPGDDNDEYVELFGTEGDPLDGLTYLVIGDGTGGSGVIEAVVDLTGSSIAAGSGGFFLAAESTFSLGPTPDLVTTLDFENSDNVTHLVVRDFTGAGGDDLDLDDDCVLDVTPWSEIVDSVSLKESDPPDCFYSPTVVGPDGSFVPGHVYRCEDGTGDFVIGLFDPAGGDDTPRAPNLCVCETVITKQPADQVGFEGGTVMFMVSATGEGAITFQWRKDGIDLVDGGNITGSQTDVLTIDPVSEADEGVYDVLVTSDCGPVTSDGATLTVVPLPTVVLNEIRTDQSGTDNDEYFELFGEAGTPLDGVTYVVIGDGADGSGVIEAVIDLTGQVIPADGHFLAVEETFTAPCADTPDLILPGNGINFENSDNVTHLLVAGFTGALGDDLDPDDDCVLDSTPWFSILDDVSLKESDPPDCFYGSTVLGPDGTFVPGHVYRCPDGTGSLVIGKFDFCGDDETPGLVNAACITSQPTGGEACEGEPLVLTVAAEGIGTLTFQWRKDGIDLVDGGRVSGAMSDTLTIDPVFVSDAGSYTVVVTDDNSSVESDPADITVEPLFDVRAGNVNGGVGPVVDVLTLNGETGSDPQREITIDTTTDAFVLTILAPPSLERARYAVFLWLGEPDKTTRETLPEGTGDIAMPTPLTGTDPQPRRIANILKPALGESNWWDRFSPLRRAPFDLIVKGAGGATRTGFTVYVQGVLQDPDAPNGKAAVTNGLVIRLVP